MAVANPHLCAVYGVDPPEECSVLTPHVHTQTGIYLDVSDRPVTVRLTTEPPRSC